MHPGFGRLQLEAGGTNSEKMLSRKRESSPRLDLRLNLSPVNSSSEFQASSNNSSEKTEEGSSGVSWEAGDEGVETRTMVLAGCGRCLMYVLLSEADPKCPKCKSTVLLDIVTHHTSTSTTTKT
ncbi:protein GL2-INTERACTING REPRESSOR 2 [Prosopis cineraria]|uniref:protein GL2-INTERACTING REPRESSOR 2 n=1 Tax=Prosopis cineraria TaxID=364024 RepID=UPI0024103BDE|nr:protein GL2-INTERACTING REPRESSOR 2 [Prosopis cineraria]